jgi:hypothetical protein
VRVARPCVTSSSPATVRRCASESRRRNPSRAIPPPAKLARQDLSRLARTLPA